MLFRCRKINSVTFLLYRRDFFITFIKDNESMVNLGDREFIMSKLTKNIIGLVYGASHWLIKLFSVGQVKAFKYIIMRGLLFVIFYISVLSEGI